jgi:hypothetical protein
MTEYGQEEECSRHHVQTGSESHSISFPMSIGGSFPESKTAGVWTGPLTCTYRPDLEYVELIHHAVAIKVWYLR